MGLGPQIRQFSESLKRLPGYMLVLALGVGLLGGLGAVGFRELIGVIQGFAWNTDAYSVAWVQTLPWYVVVGLPAAGGLLVGALVRWLAREARGHGVPEVMEAVARQGGQIRPRVVVVKAAASSVCIASGGSVGREGPIVQIGSAWGSAVGQFLGLRPRRLRTLVGCGAAAGIAATFNAPIAGAFFAVEVILGDFGLHQFSPIVIASVSATAVSHAYFADVPAFVLPTYQVVHPLELVAYVLLGAVAALLGAAFIKLLYKTEDLFDMLPVSMVLRATLGGALVGTLALAYPQILGLGYETIESALAGNAPALLLGGLLLAKLAASSVTLGSGGSGGIFAPSMFLGATVGGLLGFGLDALWPGMTAPPGAYAMVGMAAVVAATTHAPITAILILFELTSDYGLMLPLMSSCVVATLLSGHLNKGSIYTTKLLRRGINVLAGQDINLLAGITVREVMNEETTTIPTSESLASVIRHMAGAEHRCLYVESPEGLFAGVITLRELGPVLKDVTTLGNLIVAHDLVQLQGPVADRDESLDSVLQRLDVGYRDELPVIAAGKLAGVVCMQDILRRYRTELTRRSLDAGTEQG